MSTLGIITEYNPFHNGHLYHLQQAKLISESEAVVCILNGNFMQRGLPALTDKWTRTKMALANGVDLVLELPLIYGIRSAEFFAEGTVKLLAATGITDTLVFGSESGNLDNLSLIAEILLKEPPLFKNSLQRLLAEGNPFPAARAKALLSFLKEYEEQIALDINQVKDDLSEPNNILGIEYLKAIKKNNLQIEAVTIKRSHNNYHSQEITDKIASATGIREIIMKTGQAKNIKPYVPETTFRLLAEELNQGKIPLREDLLGIMILSKLRKMTPQSLLDYGEIENGLENRFYQAAHSAGCLEELITAVKTRAFTRTRIQRNLLHILFGLTEEKFSYFDRQGPAYLRVLGFSKKGETLISQMSKKSRLPVITQPADYLNQIDLKTDDQLISQLSYDLMATDLYTLLYKQPVWRKGQLDYYTPIIKTP